MRARALPVGDNAGTPRPKSIFTGIPRPRTLGHIYKKNVLFVGNNGKNTYLLGILFKNII